MVELDRGKSRSRPTGAPATYTGIRTPTAILIEHRGAIDPATGGCTALPTGVEYELYDLATDPFQLQSLAAPGLVTGHAGVRPVRTRC